MRLRDTDVRAGLARPIPPEQDGIGQAGEEGTGQAFPSEGLHPQSVRHQFHQVSISLESFNRVSGFYFFSFLAILFF